MSVTLDSKNQFIIPALYQSRGKPRQFNVFPESFLLSGLAPALAVLFTNPFDTAKVRLQLQTSEIRYKNSFDALNKIYASEGLKGLQKGLVPAIFREGSKNAFRIGMFDPIMNLLHDSKKSRAPGYKRVFAGSLCGVMGAVSANPFELIKTRLQSSATGLNAVGFQHGYLGVYSGLSQIWKTEGFRGLYRGSFLSMGRSIVGSGANLSTFSLLKEYLLTKSKWKDGTLLDMVCGLSSGAVSVLFMNPIDVIRTRFYNQSYENGKGSQYKSGIDAVKKIFIKEGVTAFYKGLFSHFLRIGPHFCLTFMFLGVMRRNVMDYYSYLDRKDAFNSFDVNNDGKLDHSEVRLALEKIFESLGDNEPDAALIAKFTKDIVSKSNSGTIPFDSYPEMEEEVKRIYKMRMNTP